MKKMITQNTLLAFVCSFLSGTIFSQVSRIDSLFNIPGYLNGGILVTENGAVVYQHSFGTADFKTGKQISNGSGFQSASVSKIITSTAILQLVDKKKIKLTDSFKKYFPNFPYVGVTIRHLLSHTSGLPDAELFDSLVASQPAMIVKNADVLPQLVKQQRPLHFIPGSKFEYCNTGYQLLALLVETVSKTSFFDYLQKNIFLPCGMKDSYLRSIPHSASKSGTIKNNITYPTYSISPQDVDSIAPGKNNRFLHRLYYDNHTMGGTYGDQNIITTTGDMSRFNNAFFTGKLISQKLVDEAIKPLVLDNGKIYTENNMALGGEGSSYGLGWEVNHSHNEIIAGHSGYNRGTLCQYYMNVTKKQFIILFDNTEGNGFVQKLLNVAALLKQQQPESIDMRKSVARYYGFHLLHGSEAAALIHFNEMKNDTAGYIFTKQGLNNLGYDFLRNGYKQLALDVFKVNLLLFPDDHNRYDSYADALSENGRKQEAKLMYRKALSLKPDNLESKTKLEELLSEN